MKSQKCKYEGCTRKAIGGVIIERKILYRCEEHAVEECNRATEIYKNLFRKFINK